MMMLIVLGIIAYVLVAAATFAACYDDGLLYAIATAVLWPCIITMTILMNIFDLLFKIVALVAVLVWNLVIYLTRF